MKRLIKKTARNGFSLPVAAALLAAVLIAGQAASEVLAKLEVTPDEAGQCVLEALAYGSTYHDGAMKAFKALPASARASIVKAGLAWAKAHTETAKFKAAYLERRESEKPESFAEGLSADEELKQQQAEFKKQAAEMRKAAAAMDAETRKAMEEAIKEMEAQLAAMAKDPEQMAMMRQMTEMQKVEDRERHDEQMREWEENFPADPRILIRNRIREFLETSADVDFSAKLERRGSLMRFADSEYEGKSPDWKLCFRAGKEATEAARDFAKSWLAELEKL
jgi:flagellar biosynthesis GTPase FlhF